MGILVLVATLWTAGMSSAAGGVRAVDGGRWGQGRHATLEGVLKKTLFRIKVVHVHMRVDTATERALTSIVGGQRYSPERAMQVAATVMDANDVLITTRLQRNVPFELYIDALYADLAKAERSGLISSGDYQALAWLVPEWLEPIETRGLKKNDTLNCRVNADGLRIVYTAADGTVLLDRAVRGREAGRAVLATYLAPGTQLSDMLVRSLFN